MRSPILSERARALFDAKGPENAARVRRVLRLLGVVHGRAGDLTGLRVLDLGCGEGVFALEAALAGASVLGIDGRAERMDAGRVVAAELGLDGVELVNADLRAFPFEERGPFEFYSGADAEATLLVVAAVTFLIVLLAGLVLWATDRFSAERQADEAYQRVRSRGWPATR